jgi:succinate dehydrogenase/fumarate reductase flavoprotein subunit
MGNSLLDVMVYGRIAGVSAADYAKKKYKAGKLTLDHVKKYHAELKKVGVDVNNRVSPMILPDYSNPDVRKKQLTTHYVGTLRS